MTTKPCIKCGKTQELNQFYHNRRECRSCLKKRTRLWRDTKTYTRFKKNRCEQCGFVPIHSCQLDVDHIDGNHKNDEISNLRTLCANCHRLKTYLNKETRLDRR